jgi:hypothetical protein
MIPDDLYQKALEHARTADPPKDHTTFWCASYIQHIDPKTGRITGFSDYEVTETKLYYKDYASYDHLPRVAQGEITRIEFERYKKWEAEQTC